MDTTEFLLTALLIVLGGATIGLLIAATVLLFQVINNVC